MSLRHAILGVLSAVPMTGYELVRYFNGSVGYVWSAPQSQIYPELRRMEQEGLVLATVAARGQRAEKRIYSITAAGEAELERWAAEVMEYPPDRDPVRLKVIFFDLAPFEAARAQLHAHIAHYTQRLAQWQERTENLRSRRAPLVRSRLAARPAEQHAAIVEFKAFAFEGQIARARAEIEWAQRGLELIDRLEAQRLAGGAARGDQLEQDAYAPAPAPG